MALGVDTANAIRRRIEQRADQAWAVAAHRIRPGTWPKVPGAEPAFGIVTVNASTTRSLKLMLLTLVDGDDLDSLRQVVVVDNGSRDGGLPFLRALARQVARVELVELRHFLNHARGLRAGERVLTPEAGIVLFCDPDVVWRNPATLRALGAALSDHDAAIAGEPRPPVAGRPANPNIQASFLAVRRDVLHRRDVPPPVNHGAPTVWLQDGVVRAGLPIARFPSNHGGYVLHRGRTAVAAARTMTPQRSYATARTRRPHYMHVPDGAAIWAATEERYAALLHPDAEGQLLAHLAERLAPLDP